MTEELSKWLVKQINFYSEALKSFYYVVGFALLGASFLLCFFKPSIQVSSPPPMWAIVAAFFGYFGFMFLWCISMWSSIGKAKS